MVHGEGYTFPTQSAKGGRQKLLFFAVKRRAAQDAVSVGVRQVHGILR